MSTGRKRAPQQKAAKPARWDEAAPALEGREADVAAWIERELLEQERRYRRIVKLMEALDTRRRRWVREFYGRIQASGFNVHADIKTKIAPEDVPPLPKGPVRVVF